MKRTLLIVNSASGSANAVGEDDVIAALKSAGLIVSQLLKLPDDDLPSRSAVEAGGFDVVAVLSGDGTISGLCDQISGWDGAVLVLPGGTMNLLSRRLHGDITLAALLPKLASAALKASHIPVVCADNTEILTGLTAGPSTRWGKVREGIRQGDVSGLAEVVPAAWAETLADDGVWIAGQERQAYAGIFVEPVNGETLSVIAFRANTLGDMVGHGLAWLRRDFREGPRDDLGTMAEVTILGDDPETGVLLDGEYDEHRLPLVCTAAMSSVRFLTVQQ
jgi:hypothetical protein